ncbi:hypothetical protein HK104_006666 [Borealophlyctis nickersoniae]|nr:hypothetical protein HK104_006666 [Borealophlyctis nickersoniae]
MLPSPPSSLEPAVEARNPLAFPQNKDNGAEEGLFLPPSSLSPNTRLVASAIDRDYDPVLGDVSIMSLDDFMMFLDQPSPSSSMGEEYRGDTTEDEDMDLTDTDITITECSSRMKAAEASSSGDSGSIGTAKRACKVSTQDDTIAFLFKSPINPVQPSLSASPALTDMITEAGVDEPSSSFVPTESLFTPLSDINRPEHQQPCVAPPTPATPAPMPTPSPSSDLPRQQLQQQQAACLPHFNISQGFNNFNDWPSTPSSSRRKFMGLQTDVHDFMQKVRSATEPEPDSEVVEKERERHMDVLKQRRASYYEDSGLRRWDKVDKDGATGTGTGLDAMPPAPDYNLSYHAEVEVKSVLFGELATE